MANWPHPKREHFRSPSRRMIVCLASASRPRSGEVTTAALSKVCLPARRIAGRFLRSKVRDRQMRIRALEGSCPAILPTATDLSSYISVTVPHIGCRTRLPASSLFARENRHSEISLIWRELGDGFAPLTVASRHAPLLLELIHSPVPPHRRECAVHSSQERRLILPESDPEWLGVVGNLRHDKRWHHY